MLNSCQEKALKILNTSDNVFLTGVAGSGKSHLVRHFLKDRARSSFPILASTGAAAILVGGRTFHSFFGLGIMQGGLLQTIERATKDKRLLRRLKKVQGIVVDEISMLSGITLRAAEAVARIARASDLPWGGIQVVAVGDFAQLPPVNPFGREKDWAFQDDTWAKSDFRPALLNTMMRSDDKEFIEILNDVRNGLVTERVKTFLNERQRDPSLDFDGTVLFPHRETAEKYNLAQLEKLPGKAALFETRYAGNEKFQEVIAKNAPVPRQLHLKPDALVMIRQNDPQGRWCNGSLGRVESIGTESIKILLADGGHAEIEKVSFSYLDAEGKEVASATNFPVNLAYAATIHKAQGLTLDRIQIDLSRLWEPGQAYVALSRVKSMAGLYVTDWSPDSIKSDPVVADFNKSLWESASPKATNDSLPSRR